MESVYTYDAAGNILSLEIKTANEILLSSNYQYDGNGIRVAKAGVQTSTVLGGITAGTSAFHISCQYDVRGQLLAEHQNGTFVYYAYDRVRNRIRKTDSQGETIYKYNEKNQLLYTENAGERRRFTYDCQGSILKEESASCVCHFVYDSMHRQIRVQTDTGDVQENHYDADNLRFELLENGKRTRFVYHDGELLHEKGTAEVIIEGKGDYVLTLKGNQGLLYEEVRA